VGIGIGVDSYCTCLRRMNVLGDDAVGAAVHSEYI